MQPFSVLWSLWARLCSSLSVQELVLRSPPSISQCEQLFVVWEGGEAPYSLDGFSNGLHIFDANELTLPKHNLGIVLHGATEGDIVVLRVTDGARTVRYASYRVQPSEDDSCIQGLRGKLVSSPYQSSAWRDPPSAIFPLRGQEDALVSEDSHVQSFLSSDTTTGSGPQPSAGLVDLSKDPS